MNFLSAFSFLLQLQLGRFFRSKISYRSVRAGARDVRCDVYTPQGNSRGCVVTINGFSPLGNRDRRFVALNRALAGIGFTVYSPYLPDFCELKIHEKQISNLANLFRAIASIENISPDGKISVLAPSFAAGLCLLAASRGDTSHLRAICTIGSFAQIDSLVETLIANPKTDEYGRLILLRNFISLSIGKKPRIERALELALLDNYFKNKAAGFEEFESTMPATERKLLQRLRTDTEFRMLHWERVVRAGGRKARLLTDLSVVSHMGKMRVPATFIHGQDDDVVPASQSSALFAEAKKTGIPSRLVLTPLLSHGDTQKGLHLLPALFHLIRGFSFFFAHAKSAKGIV